MKKRTLGKAYKIHGNNYFKLVKAIGNYTYTEV